MVVVARRHFENRNHVVATTQQMLLKCVCLLWTLLSPAEVKYTNHTIWFSHSHSISFVINSLQIIVYLVSLISLKILSSSHLTSYFPNYPSFTYIHAHKYKMDVYTSKHTYRHTHMHTYSHTQRDRQADSQTYIDT